MNMSLLYRFSKSYLHPAQPSYLILFVTALCNSRCQHCFYWKNISSADKEKELTLGEIEKISKGLKSLIQATITGGEPFLRDDLPEIVSCFYKNSGARFFTITTNGILTEKIINGVERMCGGAKKAFFKIPLSIDGLCEKHDEIRGVPGNFSKLNDTYRGLSAIRQKYSNLRIEATTVLMRDNAAEIENIYKYVKEKWKVDNYALLYPRGDARIDDMKNVNLERYRTVTNTIYEDPKKQAKNRIISSVFQNISKIISEMIIKTEDDKRMSLPCLAGRKLLIINEQGRVFPCEILNTASAGFKKTNDPDEFCFGSLRDSNYRVCEILKSHKAAEIKKFIKENKCYCTFECAYVASLVFNPKMLFKLTLNKK